MAITTDDPRPITRWTLKAFTRQVIAELDKTYELVYVDYRDQLTREQIAMLVRNDFEALWDSTGEFESESRDYGIEYVREDLVRAIAQRWERCFGVDAEDLLSEWESSDGFDEVNDEIADRDRSDWVRELASHSRQVLMRHVLRGEDDSLHGWDKVNARGYPTLTATDVIEWLREGCEPGSVLKRNAQNVKVVREVLNEALHSRAYLVGMLVYAVDVDTFLDLPGDDDAIVEIVNPHLYLGNYYQGDGYCEGPLDARIRVRRGDLRTDRDAPGYGWDEVAGVYTSAYEAQIRVVNNES